MQESGQRLAPSSDRAPGAPASSPPVNVFHWRRKFSRLPKRGRSRTFAATTKRRCRQAVSIMTLVQTDCSNVVRLTHAPRSPNPIRRLAWRTAQVCQRAALSVRRRLESAAQWSTQRRTRTRLTMAERARQQRALARLSDRELRDIGITRYDVDFVLRRSCWR
jgi:Domain of unknown function (DUF1127)